MNSSPLSKILSHKISIFVALVCLINIFLDVAYDHITYLLAILIPLRFVALKKIPRDCTTFYIMWLYFELSFIGHLFLARFFISYGFSSYPLMIGEITLIAFLLSSLLLNLFLKPEKLNHIPAVKHVPLDFKHIVIFLITLSVSLTAISYYLGIIKMGVAQPDLPFKLGPLLTLSRQTVVPFFFIVFAGRELLYSKSPRRFVILTAIFNAWLLTETILKGSRGFILINNLPIILLLLVHQSRLLKTWIILLSIATPLIFITGQVLRTKNFDQSQDTLEIIKFRLTNLQHNFWEIYERNFYDARIIDKFHRKLGNRSNIEYFNTFIENGGGMQYHTYVIDGVKKGAHHSAGTTFIADSYLLFGKLGIILSVFIFALLAFFNDKIIKTLFVYDIGIYCYNIFWLFERTYWGEGFWSYFLYRNPLTSMLYPILLLCFLVANHMWRNYTEGSRPASS